MAAKDGLIKMYTLDDYNYHLPDTLIAQAPAADRDGSRLLHLNRDHGVVSHRQFKDIVSLLRPSDVLVVNNTRVVPGRLHGRKANRRQGRTADPELW
jgi:S-adenosylmethionine:tRNA ribosyltransferase-isomerase